MQMKEEWREYIDPCMFMLTLLETGTCLLTKGRWVNRKTKTESAPWTAVSRLFCPQGFSRQEYWSGLPCPPPGYLPNPGIKPRYLALQADSLLSEPAGKPWEYKRGVKVRRGKHNMQNQAEGWASTRDFLLRKGWRLTGSMGEMQGDGGRSLCMEGIGGLVASVCRMSCYLVRWNLSYKWKDCIYICICVCSVMSSLCDPIDYRPPGSSVHGIFQARITEWVAMPHSRGSSWPRDPTLVSCVSCIGRWIFFLTTKPPGKPTKRVLM